jgi:DNA helicase-2/ATP-dependent DNA helicase PcrA
MTNEHDDPLGDIAEEETLRPVRGTPPAEPPYLAALNAAQREAVEAIDGPVLVLAGAGTGKTRVLTTRLAHILATRRAWPGEILAVTFTNKAAREMKDRIGQLIGGVVEGMQWLGTFHSIGAKILRRHAELVGLKSNFTILDTDDQIRLLKQLIQAEGIDEKAYPARLLAALIDKWKNKGLTPSKVPPSEGHAYAEGKGIDMYRAYQERLKVLNATDFGDLLLENLRLFQENPDVLKTYQERFKYMLVDEYQDTNVAQYLWLRLLAQGSKNICCVGDDDQSIYGWRGAEVDNILKFEADFPGAKVVRLEQNYRSTPHILGAASGLIAANEGRLGKTLWTEATEGEPVHVLGLWDGEEEARHIGDEIESFHGKGMALHDMAILVRASFQMREFEDRFLTIGVPYRVVGGPRFYERREIRDANAYLRLIAQTDDDLAFERIVNLPKRGLGKVALQTLHHTARNQGTSLMQATRVLISTDELRPAARTALAKFVAMIDRWRELSTSLPHDELAEIVLDESGYTEMWQNDRSPEAPGRLDNLRELVRSMEQFDNLAGYLEHISLVMEMEQDSAADRISLMTLHSAKGLEFPIVFLPGWEEGLFPHQRALDESGLAGLEEERRLAYVGITRAKEQARISFAANRRMHGSWISSLPSRFIDELPEDFVEIDAAQGLYGGGGSRFDEATPVQSSYDSPGWQRMKRASETRPKGQFPQMIDEVSRLVATNDPSAASYAVGDKVRHPKFGAGTISQVDGNKLLVEFEIGAKRVISSFVEPA